MTIKEQSHRTVGTRRLGRETRRSSVILAHGDVPLAAPRQEGQGASRQQTRIWSVIADIAASFVGLPATSIDTAIEAGLRRLVEAVGIDHGAVYENTGSGLEVASSWPIECIAGYSGINRPDDLTGIAKSLLRNGMLVLWQPGVLSNKSEQELLWRHGLKSAALVGVTNGGALVGALMLGSSEEDFSWTGELEQPMRVLASVFTEVLARKRAEERGPASDNLSLAMLASLENHIIVVDARGSVTALSAGRHSEFPSSLPLLAGVRPGINYLDICRSAIDNGFDTARTVLARIQAVIDGSQAIFEVEYDYPPHAGQKFFQVTVTPLGGAGKGAVVSHIETTERRRTQENLRELSGKMIRSLEEERSRIARELHDDVSQRLALMGLEIEEIMQTLPEQHHVRQHLGELWVRTHETSLDVRQLSHRLHPSKLEYLGLVAAVKGFCNELSKRNELRIQFKHSDIPSAMNKDTALCIYRVVQESLSNVVKHSGAEEAQVVLSGSPGQITLQVSDKGVGFDAHSITAKMGIGLVGMRERLLLIGGDISIDSQPSRGTRITARVPLPDQHKNTDVLGRPSNNEG